MLRLISETFTSFSSWDSLFYLLSTAFPTNNNHFWRTKTFSEGSVRTFGFHFPADQEHRYMYVCLLNSAYGRHIPDGQDLIWQANLGVCGREFRFTLWCWIRNAPTRQPIVLMSLSLAHIGGTGWTISLCRGDLSSVSPLKTRQVCL